MKKATEVFNEWARTGKDRGMEETHAESVMDMLSFAISERQKIGKDFNFLDLGCGNGWVVRKMNKEKLCLNAAGIDGADEMIKNAKSRDQKNEYILADINSFIPKRKFDLIHSMEVLYYLDNPTEVIRKVFNSWLNNGGRLIVGVDHYFENHQSHSWEKKVGTRMLMLNEREWKDIFESAGFENIKSWRSNQHNKWTGTLVITGVKQQ